MTAFHRGRVDDNDISEFGDGKYPWIKFIVRDGDGENSFAMEGLEFLAAAENTIRRWEEEKEHILGTKTSSIIGDIAEVYPLIVKAANINMYFRLLKSGTFKLWGGTGVTNFQELNKGFEVYVQRLDSILFEAYAGGGNLKDEEIELVQYLMSTSSDNPQEEDEKWPTASSDEWTYPITDVVAHTAFYEKYGYDLFTSIRKYEQMPIKQKDTKCGPRSLNKFMNDVLTFMDADLNVVSTNYDAYAESKDEAYLKVLESLLNKIAEEKISKMFNRLYFCGGDGRYAFRFKAALSQFSLEIYQGDRVIDLDRQSTGFRWFFDFFFNFICAGGLEHGDIILMDEPGTNLHVSGIRELRKFMDGFAKKMGLTFVISTHSPFFLDCDHLDEVRLLVRDDRTGHVRIKNKFTVIGADEVDTLDQILKGLTVGRHILVDTRQKVVFVEGITDYNYLVAFKILFGPEYDSLTFFPINGIKEDEKGIQRKDIFKALLKIDRNPTLLVDGDAAGRGIRSRSKGTGVDVVGLDEIGYKEIEFLFTPEDRERFDLYSKEWDRSSVFKNSILNNANEISEDTKKRFKALMDRLLNR
jgi:hypothetical protein